LPKYRIRHVWICSMWVDYFRSDLVWFFFSKKVIKLFFFKLKNQNQFKPTGFGSVILEKNRFKPVWLGFWI
jgi:hypothetical protein